MRVLIIGGTRNLGPSIVHSLMSRGHSVTVFHRGVTRTELPRGVEVLHGDRSDFPSLERALAGRDFEAVVDTTLYNSRDAKAAVHLFSGRVSRYVFLSTGQVYLVRQFLTLPFCEEDYSGPLIAEPPREHQVDHENWQYGIDKRAAEDVFLSAAESGFPVTVLRLPMVNSERDHFHRIHGYLCRLRDGGPLLIPDGDGLPLRHVYGEDVVTAILASLHRALPVGCAFNISQDETLSLRQFLELLADHESHGRLVLEPAPRRELEAAGLLPDCSPFSDPWMSSLTNKRSRSELGMTYTPVSVYLPRIVEYFRNCNLDPPGYAQRSRELELAQQKMRPQSAGRYTDGVLIRPFNSTDGAAFRTLNEEWIKRYFKLEAKDEATLSDPQRSVIGRGGMILMATIDGQSVGCCALLRISEDEFEVAKMAVASGRQGRGVGRRLLHAAIEDARRLRARRLYLETNHVLKSAIQLCESLGFRHLDPAQVVPSPYARVDVYMELKLN
ncbi:MAG TPA: GNAT family N-acetyltransferase [Acidobacteriaceae bacterium]|jgi:nucleoside-diphosphate-sugar epimerase/GNAT superfamily N-acetyltransferase|nr:GNAT family N-acetyltransferase [Acidobacteriaceae bacterium]